MVQQHILAFNREETPFAPPRAFKLDNIAEKAENPNQRRFLHREWRLHRYCERFGEVEESTLLQQGDWSLWWRVWHYLLVRGGFIWCILVSSWLFSNQLKSHFNLERYHPELFYPLILDLQIVFIIVQCGRWVRNPNSICPQYARHC